MASEIRQYLRDKNRRPFGLIIGRKFEDSFVIGVSVCNKKDAWDKRVAYSTAYATSSHRKVNLPFAAKDNVVYDFIKRCEKYFKTTQDNRQKFIRFDSHVRDNENEMAVKKFKLSSL